MFHLSRRDTLKLLTAGFSTTSLSGWFPTFAGEAAARMQRPRSCILLWMPGGPSQLDTFDLKPDHENGGEFKSIETSVPGIRISEHFPLLAQQAQHLAIIRSMKTKEGDHGRAAFHLRTGYRPTGPLEYPTLGSLIAHEALPSSTGLPNYVSILAENSINPAAFSPGFLGPQYAPLQVGQPARQARRGQELESEYGAPLSVNNVALPAGVDAQRTAGRRELLQFVDQEFAMQRPGLPTASHQSAYLQAATMMQSTAMKAFELDEEPASLRAAYGKNRFGQACLLARRLVEQGVPFIEVTLSSPTGNGGLGWDTHQAGFETIRNLSAVLDPAWATLISDLRDRGLLETTTMLWMGEFGRTPTINGTGGRDHFPNAWSTVLAGGGIQGGQVYGETDDSGMEVTEKPVAVNELLATLMSAIGVDHTHQNLSPVGRPIRLVEPEVEPIAQLLATNAQKQKAAP
ncbi:DUF1501 domain-containing protein [Planctomicrobium sp. SH664]|uniref:DUF1501 domain-containing protein n=1 Tax=Planctomicrobium sp. SH664 TaxID=3448125 RepID=UPI003F5AE5BB